MPKKLSPLAQKKRREKRARFIKIFIPSVLGVLIAVFMIWYSCYLFGWTRFTPWQVITGKNKPYCVVENYKGLKYTGKSTELNEEDYSDYYDSMLDENPNYRKNDERDGTIVRDKDVLNIDYSGKVDGKAFDGGTAKDTFLVIGSGRFILGFEDALIGKTVGETVDINVTFPENYYEELAGKEAVFTVTVNYVADEIDGVDDDYIRRCTDYASRKDYEDGYLTAHLKEEKEASVRESQYGEVLNALIDNTEFYNLDEEIDGYYDSMLKYYNNLASNYGMTLENYVSFAEGVSLSQFQTDLAAMADITIKEKYAVNYVAKKEKLKVTDEVYEKYIQSVTAENGYTSRETFEAENSKSDIKDMILISYALDRIFSYAVEG